LALNKSRVVSLAQKYLHKGQHDKAIKELLHLLDDNPNDLRLCQKLGDLYAKKGDKKNAREYYERIARDYQDKGFYLKAIAVYKQILRIQAEQHDVHLILAELYNRQGLPGDAIAQYRTVSSFYEKEGKIKEALEVIRKMAELYPSNVAIRTKLIENFLKEGLREEASQEIKSLFQEFKKKGDMEGLITVLKEFLNLDSANNKILLFLGRAYLEKGDKDLAQESINKALQADENNVEAVILLARIHKMDGNIEKACNSLKRVIDLEPESIEARKELAECFISGGETGQAVKEYEAIIDIYLKEKLFNEAADFIENLKDEFQYDKAILIKTCEVYKSADKENSLIRSYKKLGDLYIRKGDEEAAKEIYKKVLELRPDDCDALNLLGDAGDEAEADIETDVLSEVDEETVLSFDDDVGASLTESDTVDRKGQDQEVELLLDEDLPLELELEVGDEVVESRLSQNDMSENIKEEPKDGELSFEDMDFNFDTADESNKVEAGEDISDFDSMFDAIAGGVIETGEEVDDGETHYNLGIAYKEMGLYDDAIKEFKLLVDNQERACDAYVMLGLCFLESGRTGEAIDCFKKGLALEGLASVAEMNIAYELGMAYKKANMIKEAKETLEKVYLKDKSFRDIEKQFTEIVNLE